MQVRSSLALGAAALAVGAARSAEARITAPPFPPWTGEPPEAPIAAPLSGTDVVAAAQRIERTVERIAQRQRVGPVDSIFSSPIVTGAAARPWLPDVRTAPARDQSVGPLPALPVDLAPLVTEITSTQVAEARGNDGLLMTVQVRFPWMIP